MEESDSLIGRLLPADLVLDPDGPVLDDALWEATEGGPDRQLVERLRAAWQRLRDGFSTPKQADDVDGTSLAPESGS